MADTPELKKIKKIYGEKFKNLCRSMFPVILEQEGTLLNILEKRFSHNCNSLYENLTENGLESEFKELIYSEFDLKREKEEQAEERTPYEILDEAGYNLYECKTEDDIQSFRKYYAPNEVLCTIYNGGRLATRDCFFAVRKDVDKIERENFRNPKKEDEYSTSVLGIQFTRDAMCTVEIISRYNHTVINPNCTLENDLDKLTPGLGKSFENLLKERGLEFNNLQKNEKLFEIPGYTLAGDGRYYKYNNELNGVYYCPGNIMISGGEIIDGIPAEKAIIVDYFGIDLKNKIIGLFDKDLNDSFVDGLKDIEKIGVEKAENGGKTIKVYQKDKKEPVIIGVDRDNKIVKYENQYIQEVENNFLRYNKKLETVNMPKLERVGDDFLSDNEELTEADFPKLKEVGRNFLAYNAKIERINMPKLERVENNCLMLNKELTEIDCPQLKEIGDNFLFLNGKIERINMPKLKRVGNGFLSRNEELKEIYFSELKEVEDDFLSRNRKIESVNMPKLERVGNDFLSCNEALKEVYLSELKGVGINFLSHNKKLERVNMPKLKRVGEDFFKCNEELTEVDFPELKEVMYGGFLENNSKIEKVNMPRLERAGWKFLKYNEKLKEVYLPELKKADYGFLENNKKIERVNIPKLERAEYSFLSNNEELVEVCLPILKEVGENFLVNNNKIERVDMPELEIVCKDFLKSNRNIKKVNMPKLQKVKWYNEDIGAWEELGVDSLENPELKKLLENKNVSKTIAPSDIAVLDKKSELKTSEVESVKEALKEIFGYTKKAYKESPKKDDVER